MISVVVPAFNRIKFIGSTLESIYQQKVECSLDVIVVDDGSSDGTADWVEAHFPSVNVIRQINKGVSAARNIGVRNAKAEVIAFCDSDDLMLPGRLAVQYRFLQSNPSVVVVAGNFLDFSSEKGVSRACRFNHSSFGIKSNGSGIAKGFLKNCIRVGNPLFSTGMFRKDAFLSIGGFSEELRACEDFELRARIAIIGDIGIIDKPLILVRNDLHERISSKSMNSNPYELMVDYWIDKQSDFYLGKNEFKKHVNRWASHIVMQAFLLDNTTELRRLINKYRARMSLEGVIKAYLVFFLRTLQLQMSILIKSK